MVQTDTTMATEYKHAERKFKKHMVEKRRRNRINYALEQLKRIVLNGLQKDPTQYDKMEKADILDLTVSYLFKVKSNVMGRRFTSTPVTSFPVPPCDYFPPMTSHEDEPPRRVMSPLSCVPFDENNNAVGHVNLNYANYPQQTPLLPSGINFNHYQSHHHQKRALYVHCIESIENDSLEDLNNSWTSSTAEEHRDDVTDDVTDDDDSNHSAISEKDERMWRPW